MRPKLPHPSGNRRKYSERPDHWTASSRASTLPPRRPACRSGFAWEGVGPRCMEPNWVAEGLARPTAARRPVSNRGGDAVLVRWRQNRVAFGRPSPPPVALADTGDGRAKGLPCPRPTPGRPLPARRALRERSRNHRTSSRRPLHGKADPFLGENRDEFVAHETIAVLGRDLGPRARSGSTPIVVHPR